MPTEDDLRKAMKENALMRATLNEIGDAACACWTQMQGRLQDNTHKLAHQVLGKIIRAVAASPAQNTPRDDSENEDMTTRAWPCPGEFRS